MTNKKEFKSLLSHVIDFLFSQELFLGNNIDVLDLHDWIAIKNILVKIGIITNEGFDEIVCNYFDFNKKYSMTPLTITYSTDIPQWIKDKNYGDLWNAIPNQIIKNWFDDDFAIQYLCGQIKRKFDNVVDCHWNDSPNDFLIVKGVSKINTIIVDIKYGSDITVIQKFIEGFTETGLYCSRLSGVIGKVVKIDYDGNVMKSYEFENGAIQHVKFNPFGNFYEQI